VSYFLLPEALNDINSIISSIAADNPRAAERWLDRLEKIFENLGTMPFMGVARFDVRPHLRLFAVNNYLILHRVDDDDVVIVRVVHGAREWQDLV
jgi:toxin ParE1/3/4